MHSIAKILESFNKKKVLIVGDVMLDRYLWGTINRTSPEAPIPIVNILKRENRLGGAANVAINISALGGKPILISVIGNDKYGADFLSLLEKNHINKDGILKLENRKTTLKTRVFSKNKNIFRFDEEQTEDINTRKTIQLIEKIINSQQIDVIIFQDYNKGVLTKELIKKVLYLAKKNGIPTVVDPKKKNFFYYKGVDLFKPNLKEINESLETKIDTTSKEKISYHVTKLRNKIQAKSILLTLSDQGIYFQNENQNLLEVAHKRNIRDVSGAGDTVVSVSALALASGLNGKEMMIIANFAGGLVCEKVGVAPILKEDLIKINL